MNRTRWGGEEYKPRNPTQPEMVLYLSGKQIIHFLLAFCSQQSARRF